MQIQVFQTTRLLRQFRITALYFNPLNDAPSLHKFDARNWRHIDRNFGPNPSKDVKTIESEIPNDPSTLKFTEADKLFLKLIKECHKRDIKIIMDYSWNHTGVEFWAWKDVEQKQALSDYADWYWLNILMTQILRKMSLSITVGQAYHHYQKLRKPFSLILPMA